MEQITKIYNYLIEHDYFTDGELELLTNINGYNEETLNDAIYSRYGFRDFNQLTNCEDEGEK